VNWLGGGRGGGQDCGHHWLRSYWGGGMQDIQGACVCELGGEGGGHGGMGVRFGSHCMSSSIGIRAIDMEVLALS
jgi:hypothetical protein